jgi:SOS response regulatory protein OraA/RecX
LAFKLKEKFGPDSENGKKYWGITSEEINFIISEKLRNIIQEEEVIKSKIRNYINKWKSKLYIKQKLFERMEDKDLWEKYLNKAFINWELENIKKVLKKLWFSEELEYNEKQRILKKLLTKGFRYDEIKQII